MGPTIDTRLQDSVTNMEPTTRQVSLIVTNVGPTIDTRLHDSVTNIEPTTRLVSLIVTNVGSTIDIVYCGHNRVLSIRQHSGLS